MSKNLSVEAASELPKKGSGKKGGRPKLNMNDWCGRKKAEESKGAEETEDL